MMGHQTISGTLQQVAQPVFVNVRDERDRELNVFRKMVRFASFLSFPALFGLSLVAHEFILCTIGTKWIDCIPLLQILCISGAFMPLYTLLQNLVISHGRSDVNLWLNLSQTLFLLILILLTYRHGIITVVWAYTILNIVWLLVWLVYANKLIGIRFIDMLKDIVPFAVISMAVMAITWYLTSFIDNNWLLLIARIIIAAVLYGTIMKLLKVKMMEECLNFLKRIRF